MCRQCKDYTEWSLHIVYENHRQTDGKSKRHTLDSKRKENKKSTDKLKETSCGVLGVEKN